MMADNAKMQQVKGNKDSKLETGLGALQIAMLCIWQIVINITTMCIDISYPYGLGQTEFNSILSHTNQEDTIVLVDDHQSAQVTQMLQYKYNKPMIQISNMQEYAYADWQTCIRINDMAVEQLKNNADSCLSKYGNCKFIYVSESNCDVPENVQSVFNCKDISGYTYGIISTRILTDKVYLLTMK